MQNQPASLSPTATIAGIDDAERALRRQLVDDTLACVDGSRQVDPRCLQVFERFVAGEIGIDDVREEMKAAFVPRH